MTQATVIDMAQWPLGDVLYLWPPLTNTEAELGTMLEILYKSTADITGA
ncbi:MAG: hypothetical protein L3K26_16580 [Candidatus Hydrogenedentes bacterium]|nr:hypothetical protein [Candidatus Hydrogenedentota bacterium]